VFIGFFDIFCSFFTKNEYFTFTFKLATWHLKFSGIPDLNISISEQGKLKTSYLKWTSIKNQILFGKEAFIESVSLFLKKLLRDSQRISVDLLVWQSADVCERWEKRDFWEPSLQSCLQSSSLEDSASFGTSAGELRASFGQQVGLSCCGAHR